MSHHQQEESKQLDTVRKSLNQSPKERSSSVGTNNIEVNLQEFESIIISILDLVACKDHVNLQTFLETVMLDLTKVYDERGFTLVHIACINCDHKTLDVLIAAAFRYWDKQQNISRQESLHCLQNWVNQASMPPDRAP